MSEPAIQMPQYRSQEAVWALKIRSVVGSSIVPDEYGFAPIEMDAKWMEKNAPESGEYLVFYPGGHREAMSAGGFEARYVKLPDRNEPRISARLLTGHKVNPANDRLQVEALDGPGPGGASHRYLILLPPGAPVPVTGINAWPLDFQNGPINDGNGLNGVTHEALLAILIDRLHAFQAGPYACNENMRALSALTEAQSCLHERTEARMARGVEGTHKV